jgi:hypothetical protein
VESVHPGLSPRLGTGVRIFLDLFPDLTVLCLVGDDATVVTSDVLIGVGFTCMCSYG